MKTICIAALIALSALAEAPAQISLRTILLDQLRTTHNKKDWFVPANIAVEGLTPKQVTWTDGSGNHSIGQLANHLVFWNEQQLAKMKGETPAKFSGNNDETFNSFNAAQWDATVKQLDQVLTDLEKLVQTMPQDRLEHFASDFSHIAGHNAYHIGQIVYLRKLQGSWDPAKGVR
jgi:uncharacterized damage-inducible protein DinB